MSWRLALNGNIYIYWWRLKHMAVWQQYHAISQSDAIDKKKTIKMNCLEKKFSIIGRRILFGIHNLTCPLLKWRTFTFSVEVVCVFVAHYRLSKADCGDKEVVDSIAFVYI